MKKVTLNLFAAEAYITNWLKEYTAPIAKCFVIGVSGGIDSAVVSTLCAKTQLPVYCVTMPIHQPAGHMERAKKHIDWLKTINPKVVHIENDLTSSFDRFAWEVYHSIGKSTGEDSTVEITDYANANARSRMRMMSLYYVASLYNGLVAGTGNKVEDFGIGFFTKYGDGGVDISPIGDLLKSEVYALGKHMGIIEEIITAKPTDGLWNDGRSDEDAIGATYDELEWAMEAYNTIGNLSSCPNNELDTLSKLFTAREIEILKIYSKRHEANKHKLNPIPICTLPPVLHLLYFIINK